MYGTLCTMCFVWYLVYIHFISISICINVYFLYLNTNVLWLYQYILIYLDSDTIQHTSNNSSNTQYIRLIAKHKVNAKFNNEKRSSNNNRSNSSSHNSDPSTTTTTTSTKGNNSDPNEITYLRNTPWPSNIPDYLSFILIKENIDTLSALNQLSNILHFKVNNIGVAGTKDKVYTYSVYSVYSLYVYSLYLIVYVYVSMHVVCYIVYTMWLLYNVYTIVLCMLPILSYLYIRHYTTYLYLYTLIHSFYPQCPLYSTSVL